MEKIKEVLFTDEANLVVLVLENDKSVTRKLKRDINDYKYFKYCNQEYFLNKLRLENIATGQDS